VLFWTPLNVHEKVRATRVALGEALARERRLREGQLVGTQHSLGIKVISQRVEQSRGDSLATVLGIDPQPMHATVRLDVAWFVGSLLRWGLAMRLCRAHAIDGRSLVDGHAAEHATLLREIEQHHVRQPMALDAELFVDDAENLAHSLNVEVVVGRWHHGDDALARVIEES